MDINSIPDEYFERYNPGQGTEQNAGITPDMYKAWKNKKKMAKLNDAKAEKQAAKTEEKAKEPEQPKQAEAPASKDETVSGK